MAALVFAFTPMASASTFKVVIDPGHGGNDEGTVYENGNTRITEKAATLLLAKETANELRKRGILVALTRKTDQEVAVHARTALANRLKADVFLSIHMNSSATPMIADAEGVETYILNNTTDASSRRLAQLENAVLINSVDRARAAEPDVALILKDLRLDANLSESKRLACSIHSNLLWRINSKAKPDHRIRDRGVRQALFYVLLGADMPSVLLEAGFLASPVDRATVLSPRGRKAMASAIAAAIDRFRQERGTEKARIALSRCKVH